MIPLITPNDGFVVNLLQMASWRQHSDGSVVVKMADGSNLVFTDEAAKIVTAEVAFLVNQYRQMQRTVTSPPPMIVTPETIN